MAFEEVCSTVTNQICRVIFSDLLNMIKDFGTSWLSYKGGGSASGHTESSGMDPWSSMLLTTKDFLWELTKRQESVLFHDTFVSCVDIVVMRYLTFLLEVPYIYGTTFTSEHIAHMEADMTYLNAMFNEKSGFTSHAGVALRLSVVKDATTLITSGSTDSDEFEGRQQDRLRIFGILHYSALMTVSKLVWILSIACLHNTFAL